jgi:hypothetical protein
LPRTPPNTKAASIDTDIVIITTIIISMVEGETLATDTLKSNLNSSPKKSSWCRSSYFMGQAANLAYLEANIQTPRIIC